MNNKQFYREIGEIDEDLIEEAHVAQKKVSPNKKWIKLFSIAASIVLIVGISISLINGKKNNIDLLLSKGDVKVYYTDNAPRGMAEYNLVSLTEEELFNKRETTIVKGTITEIKNIVIDFNGQKAYKAIVKIKVSKVYRGNCNENDTISVLSDILSEDTYTASAMREGMTGIFMPVRYTESFGVWIQNGVTLYEKDIADYGLMDGVRYAFLETEKGLVFSRWAYESISNAQTLDEIEDYIKLMIK